MLILYTNMRRSTLRLYERFRYSHKRYKGRTVCLGPCETIASKNV